MVSVSGMTRNERLLQTPLQRAADGSMRPWRRPCTVPTPRMTFWCVKQAVALGVLTLVGCTTAPPASLSQPASLAQPHLTKDLPAAPQGPVQSLALADKGPDVPLHDQPPPPRVADVPLNQRGWASWYGKKFNGQRTASGERFSASGFTAAHRTLPFHSYVRVRRVASGEEVIVRITDRGPFHPGRVLDLSHAAAERIGLVALGGAEVEIEPLTEDDRRLGSPP